MTRLLPILAAILALSLAACQAPSLTGIAAGVGDAASAPAAPLTDPSHATFAFLPFEGVPGNQGDELLRRVWDRAEREGLTVVKRPGGRALFFVEGAVTAVTDDTNSLIFFAFDVKDTAGNRLHRISGQERSLSSEGDPWANVETEDLDLIARRLAALLRAWLYTAS